MPLTPVGILAVCVALHAATVIALTAQTPARTVWDGVFTAEQADRGRAQYAASCARCHGGNLEGGMGRSLVGSAFLDKWREQSVGDLLEYVSRNMPMGQPSALPLSPAVYADIVAYMLRSNELPPGVAELDAASGAGALIVPRSGSTGELPATTLARVVGCLGPQESDRSWRLSRASKPERLRSIDGGALPSGSGGDRQYELKFVLQPLTPLVGQQVAVVGLLIGDGGKEGINVSTVTAMRATCD